MNHLPLNDIPMLVSAVNMLLRDGGFDDLDDVCQTFGVDAGDLVARLEEAGFAYSAEQNRIV